MSVDSTTTHPWCYECGPLTAASLNWTCVVNARALWTSLTRCPECGGFTDGIPIRREPVP